MVNVIPISITWNSRLIRAAPPKHEGSDKHLIRQRQGKNESSLAKAVWKRPASSDRPTHRAAVISLSFWRHDL